MRLRPFPGGGRYFRRGSPRRPAIHWAAVRHRAYFRRGFPRRPAIHWAAVRHRASVEILVNSPVRPSFTRLVIRSAVRLRCFVQASIDDSSHPPCPGASLTSGSCETTHNASPFLRMPRQPSVPPFNPGGGICTLFRNSVEQDDPIYIACAKGAGPFISQLMIRDPEPHRAARLLAGLICKTCRTHQGPSAEAYGWHGSRR